MIKHTFGSYFYENLSLHILVYKVSINCFKNKYIIL